ncbi:MAG: hypothetical protein IT381_01855 [Deltaproteobacteria bacterium]|nr:hypothetical protein [Deltaproteobacteria bacterium]
MRENLKTRMPRRQVMLFPPVARGDAVPAEAKEELVQALACLLLEAMKVATDVEGGRDDQHEDHA